MVPHGRGDSLNRVSVAASLGEWQSMLTEGWLLTEEKVDNGATGDLGDGHVFPARHSAQGCICAPVEIYGQAFSLGASAGSRHKCMFNAAQNCCQGL